MIDLHLVGTSISKLSSGKLGRAVVIVNIFSKKPQGLHTGPILPGRQTNVTCGNGVQPGCQSISSCLVVNGYSVFINKNLTDGTDLEQ
jgi:hypothetical protein